MASGCSASCHIFGGDPCDAYPAMLTTHSRCTYVQANTCLYSVRAYYRTASAIYHWATATTYSPPGPWPTCLCIQIQFNRGVIYIKKRSARADDTLFLTEATRRVKARRRSIGPYGADPEFLPAGVDVAIYSRCKPPAPCVRRRHLHACRIR
jgi:hypothetical protein